jgi:mannose-6-phosphate isomerase-like protein (cupin superfamily)/CDGSH-type Zn-finger protein
VTPEPDKLPVVASPRPFYVELKAGRAIAWCRCGRSTRQPYCDGRSHLGTGFEPLIYRATAPIEEVLLCGCKRTCTPPFCDGSHNNLPGGYRSDPRSEEELARIPLVEPDPEGISRLDGQCYVITPRVPSLAGSPFRIRSLIGAELGAEHQAQYYIELEPGTSPVMTAGSADIILWLYTGRGEAEISGRSFPLQEYDGAYVAGGEAFRLTNEGPETMIVYASICPAAPIEFLDAMPANFDAGLAQRVRQVDTDQRSEMGPRWFQMLVEKSMGLTSAAQFIGHIPPSRGESHRHLYEEALIIASGSGMMWTENSRAAVRAGDVIFLPRKHAHSLECTDPAGMNVVGVIHPGDNPSINY